MQRKTCTDNKERCRLDSINDERLETTKKHVANAIGLLKPWTWRISSNDEDKQKMLNDFSHAINLLEAANQDMLWHCEWYDYDQDICSQIDDACTDIGISLADIINDEDDDIDMLTIGMKDGLVKLSKALATLIRWNEI